MADPLDIPKYRNAPHAAYTIVKEEGVRALYKGVTLTALRQGIYFWFSIIVINALLFLQSKQTGY
jgi:hypothetical protein